MRKIMTNLRKSVVLGLVGGASMLAVPGGCGTAGELFQMGWDIGAGLANAMDEEEDDYGYSGYDDYFWF